MDIEQSPIIKVSDKSEMIRIGKYVLTKMPHSHQCYSIFIQKNQSRNYRNKIGITTVSENLISYLKLKSYNDMTLIVNNENELQREHCNVKMFPKISFGWKY